jgi:predicted Zn-dependent protease with MMP-like domain
MNSQAWAGAAAPSLDDFASLAEAALARLPEPFRTMAGDVRMRVADFADERLLADMGIEDAFELTGVYIGVDLRRQSVLDPAPHPSEVLLFRRPILDEWAERGDVALGDLIEHVLVHEIGHHFGLSDDDIHAAEED